MSTVEPLDIKIDILSAAKGSLVRGALWISLVGVGSGSWLNWYMINFFGVTTEGLIYSRSLNTHLFLVGVLWAYLNRDRWTLVMRASRGWILFVVLFSGYVCGVVRKFNYGTETWRGATRIHRLLATWAYPTLGRTLSAIWETYLGVYLCQVRWLEAHIKGSLGCGETHPLKNEYNPSGWDDNGWRWSQTSPRQYHFGRLYADYYSTCNENKAKGISQSGDEWHLCAHRDKASETKVVPPCYFEGLWYRLLVICSALIEAGLRKFDHQKSIDVGVTVTGVGVLIPYKTPVAVMAKSNSKNLESPNKRSIHHWISMSTKGGSRCRSWGNCVGWRGGYRHMSSLNGQWRPIASRQSEHFNVPFDALREWPEGK